MGSAQGISAQSSETALGGRHEAAIWRKPKRIGVKPMQTVTLCWDGVADLVGPKELEVSRVRGIAALISSHRLAAVILEDAINLPVSREFAQYVAAVEERPTFAEWQLPDVAKNKILRQIVVGN